MMTSEIEALKTNEFLRRRKLRIQQVREQSKDIAKKIRERASAEKFRHLVDLDTTKGRIYLEQQDKLVRKLEDLCAKSLNNVGAGHKKAAEVTEQGNKQEKTDLSKKRARVAAAELRKQKQEKLDERKKSLDRKLIAREIANEISREKCSSSANNKSKISNVKTSEEFVQTENNPQQTSTELNNDKESRVTSEMATQWDQSLPPEWEPHIPVLSLPKEDTPKEAPSKESKSETVKRKDLFALSEEMPSSLRGGLTRVPEEPSSTKPSFTLVSDYLQNRDLRLREHDTVPRKPNEELQKIKETLMRTRVARAEGRLPLCHVADCQVIPVPSWQAEVNCGFCKQSRTHKCSNLAETRQFKNVTNSQINKIFSSIRPIQHELCPSPVLRGSSPFKRSKVYPGTFSAKGPTNREKPSKPVCVENSLSKKSSVTMYNHSTRDVKDVPCSDKRFVVRDEHTNGNDDAYSNAMKESSIDNSKEKDSQKKLQDLRHRIAVTKQNVEKEYKDTMAFLKSLPKDNSKPIKNAYRDDQQQQMHKECRQRKLQQEFRKIQQECRKHPHLNSKSAAKSKSPVRVEPYDDDFEAKDFQYSWMPVPESDGNLAIHTIPTTVKENKSGGAVRFSKIDSYHEYRSRHKHTPPTKDTPSNQKQKEIIITENGNESDSSSSSDTSSVEDIRLNKSIANKAKKYCDDGKLSDAERIIIYKILDTKEKTRAKQNSKIIKDIAKSLSVMTKDRLPSPTSGAAHEVDSSKSNKIEKHAKTRVSFEQLKEGVYKTINEKGDNIAPAYFKDIPQDQHGPKLTTEDTRSGSVEVACGCDSTETKPALKNMRQSSASTSTTSFQTAANDKTALNVGIKPTIDANKPPDGLIKIVDEKGEESAKFYIGATGFLKDDDYEVIIQLRKKDAAKADGNEIQNVVEEKPTHKESNIPLITDKSDVQQSRNGNVDPAPLTAESSKDTCSSQYVDTAANIQISNQNKTDQHFLDIVEFDYVTESLEEYKQKQFIDQGVHAQVKDFVFPGNFAEANSTMKPANSVSTQTTLESPNQRPVFIHMSSSTSTAYMSPPEFILPPFLKHNEKLNFVADVTSDMNDPRFKEEDLECRDQYDDGAFYRYSRSNRINKQVVSPCRSSIKNNRKCRAPPNTARSLSSGYDDHFTHSCRRKIYSSNSFPLKKCKKCEKHSQMKLYLNSLPRKSRSNVPPIQKPRWTNSSLSHRMRTKATKNRLPYGTHDMNPVIKWYIDKLLTMNRDGLKTVEVMDQECSAITTPGSSIIDVPQNIKRRKWSVAPKISLQQMKDNITSKILEEFKLQPPQGFEHYKNIGDNDHVTENNIFKKFMPRNPRKKSVHKVKSLNISKHLISSKSKDKPKSTTKAISSSTTTSEASSSKTDDCLKSMPTIPSRTKSRSKSSPSPRRNVYDKLKRKNNSADLIKIFSSDLTSNNSDTDKAKTPSIQRSQSATKAEFEVPRPPPASPHGPLSISTQTSRIIDEEINYIKLAESKLQNMEKIADLTEKCTKRLSNLAKVLDEVRRNKSIAYSQVSDPASDTDRTSTKNSDALLPSSSTYEPVIEIREKENVTPPPSFSSSSPKSENTETSYVPLLKNIPKPRKSKSPPPPQKPKRASISPTPTLKAQPGEHHIVKNRGKPPPALSRKCLKRAPEVVVPHELSTVIEVDSPLSTKFKSHTSRTENNTKYDEYSKVSEFKETTEKSQHTGVEEEQVNNPDLVQSNANLSRRQTKVTMDSADETKMQMMDLRKFNEIMLKPFISIQEYAKQCNITNVEEPSNSNMIQEDVVNEELSSLHSDGSLPDVIAELLKRNLINEPFKFETASNANSTTVSSESTLSVFALSKVKKDKKRPSKVFLNKDNVAETSDSLSMSSNPDLENAFKKLGMGWASSTLKKTKERLALSSSSNTSSSSLSQYRLKSTNNQDFPALVTDSMSTSEVLPRAVDSTKNAEQQTSKVNSMTVKQFLKNELANKITFSKSHRDDTQGEQFISLYETKMPDELKHSSNMVREERSIDSNARARTSTPVQIFKSMTYHSSSSSNISNGLFSNADDLSSVKGTSNSMRNHSTSDKDDLTIPNFSLRMRKGNSDCSKSD